MNNLYSIKSEPKKKRILKKVRFDFKGAHLAYTDLSQGGAASLKNNPYLLKANEINKDLTEEQLRILEEIGEELTPLDKNNGNVDKSNKEEDDMSKELLEELQDLKKQLAVKENKEVLSKYKFTDEILEAVAKSFANMEDTEIEAVEKAFSALVEVTEQAVKLAKEDVEKNLNTDKNDDNPLQKALAKEEGHEHKDEEVSKSYVEQAREKLAELRKEAK